MLPLNIVDTALRPARMGYALCPGHGHVYSWLWESLLFTVGWQKPQRNLLGEGIGMKQNKKKVGKIVMTAVLLILGAANIFHLSLCCPLLSKPLNEYRSIGETRYRNILSPAIIKKFFRAV